MLRLSVVCLSMALVAAPVLRVAVAKLVAPWCFPVVLASLLAVPLRLALACHRRVPVALWLSHRPMLLRVPVAAFRLPLARPLLVLLARLCLKPAAPAAVLLAPLHSAWVALCLDLAAQFPSLLVLLPAVRLAVTSALLAVMVARVATLNCRPALVAKFPWRLPPLRVLAWVALSLCARVLANMAATCRSPVAAVPPALAAP